ncbi:MAG: hypothetical protein KKA19_04795, partial [Candidatus Margulisbacteria bacterium]|nr:hypothetical protein [Candidatus Margulisiibacteriota bacterium]
MDGICQKLNNKYDEFITQCNIFEANYTIDKDSWYENKKYNELKEADTSQDGQINFEEYLKYLELKSQYTPDSKDHEALAAMGQVRSGDSAGFLALDNYLPVKENHYFYFEILLNSQNKKCLNEAYIRLSKFRFDAINHYKFVGKIINAIKNGELQGEQAGAALKLISYWTDGDCLEIFKDVSNSKNVQAAEIANNLLNLYASLKDVPTPLSIKISSERDQLMKTYFELEKEYHEELKTNIDISGAYDIYKQILGKIAATYKASPELFQTPLDKLKMIGIIMFQGFNFTYEQGMVFGAGLCQRKLDCDGFTFLYESAGEFMGWPIYMAFLEEHAVVYWEDKTEKLWYEANCQYTDTSTGKKTYSTDPFSSELELTKRSGPIVETCTKHNAFGLSAFFSSVMFEPKDNEMYFVKLKILEPYLAQLTKDQIYVNCWNYGLNYYIEDNNEQALVWFLKAFEAQPSSKAACRIGDLYMNYKKDY